MCQTLPFREGRTCLPHDVLSCNCDVKHARVKYTPKFHIQGMGLTETFRRDLWLLAHVALDHYVRVIAGPSLPICTLGSHEHRASTPPFARSLNFGAGHVHVSGLFYFTRTIHHRSRSETPRWPCMTHHGRDVCFDGTGFEILGQCVCYIGGAENFSNG